MPSLILVATEYVKLWSITQIKYFHLRSISLYISIIFLWYTIANLILSYQSNLYLISNINDIALHSVCLFVSHCTFTSLYS